MSTTAAYVSTQSLHNWLISATGWPRPKSSWAISEKSSLRPNASWLSMVAAPAPAPETTQAALEPGEMAAPLHTRRGGQQRPAGAPYRRCVQETTRLDADRKPGKHRGRLLPWGLGYGHGKGGEADLHRNVAPEQRPCGDAGPREWRESVQSVRAALPSELQSVTARTSQRSTARLFFALPGYLQRDNLGAFDRWHGDQCAPVACQSPAS